MSGDPAGPTDQALLLATLDGDEGAFVLIYERHRDRVFRFAYRMTGSPETARDVTHSAFVSLLQAPGRYDATRAGLGTYLCAAARNLSLRHASRAWRERPLSSALGLRSTGEASPEQGLLVEERARLVRDAVQALAPLHREVLIRTAGRSATGCARRCVSGRRPRRPPSSRARCGASSEAGARDGSAPRGCRSRPSWACWRPGS